MRQTLLALLACGAVSGAGTAQLPNLTSGQAKGPRFVDYADQLDQPGLLVVIGKLGKTKEGKRERLPASQLGGGGAVSSVSGTTYWKVPVQAEVLVRHTLVGRSEKVDKPDRAEKPQIGYEIQLARLPDGKEQRQLNNDTGAQLEADQLALFVLVPRPKEKALAVLHVVPCDPGIDGGEGAFVDHMYDHCTVNRYVHDLKAALAAVDAVKPPADAGKQLAALRELVDKRPELRKSGNDGLWAQAAGALEVRARKRLADADAAKVDPDKPR